MSPVLWGLLAAVGWGASDLIARLTSRTLGPIGTMWGLSVTGAPIAALMLFLFPAHLPHAPAVGLWLLAASLAALAGPLLFYRGLSLGPMSLVAPIAAAYPAWILLISLLQGFRPSSVSWLAMALVVLGGIAVARTAPADPDQTLSADPANRRQAIFFALLTSFAFAATLLTGRGAAARLGGLTTILSARLTAALATSAACPWRIAGFRSVKVWSLLALQALSDNTAFAAFYLGSRGSGAAPTAVASSAFMVVAILLAAIFLQERLNLACAAGAAAVFAGIAVLAAIAA